MKLFVWNKVGENQLIMKVPGGWVLETPSSFWVKQVGVGTHPQQVFIPDRHWELEAAYYKVIQEAKEADHEL